MGILWFIGIVPYVDFKILLFINLATLWYMALKVKQGSKHCDSSEEMCCLWNFPLFRKLENSPGFRIVMSTAAFALDLNEIGLPFMEYIPFDLFVISPSSGKSSLVFCWNASSWLFWFPLFFALVLSVHSSSLSRSGLFSAGLCVCLFCFVLVLFWVCLGVVLVLFWFCFG